MNTVKLISYMVGFLTFIFVIIDRYFKYVDSLPHWKVDIINKGDTIFSFIRDIRFINIGDTITYDIEISTNIINQKYLYEKDPHRPFSTYSFTEDEKIKYNSKGNNIVKKGDEVLITLLVGKDKIINNTEDNLKILFEFKYKANKGKEYKQYYCLFLDNKDKNILKIRKYIF